MPGRRVLANVAYGITESFVSRNNDVNGYWALGQLVTHALVSKSPSLVIDLVAGWSAPALRDQLSALPERWHQVFWNSVTRQGLAVATVARAELSAECDLGSRRDRGGRVEYLVRCRTRITDDHGHVYEAAQDVWCAPHDPAHELRSTRGA